MKKLLISTLSIFCLAGIANANISSLALTKNLNPNEITIPLTINNQANAEISTDSALIPAEAKKVAPQDAIIFEISIPKEAGTKRFRFANNGYYGCDFYIDVVEMPMMGMFTPYITAVPIDGSSMCNIFPAGGVNHLSVSFLKMQP